ncbi:hypothetical protein CN367_11650 [Priestia megaterium]|uniref:hypothetical protein n=1 Tax=Priestia megaterium TaxID=1404 RepID=UPI000BF90DB4|nr:hypothetical protein [Priestia megaterium]PEZ47018.1 hypothetical protein CN367_11650 [Priestia megaterium]
MENNKPFKRVTMAEMQKAKDEVTRQKLIDDAIMKLDEEINEHCERLANQLVNERGLDVDSFEIHTRNTIEGDTLIVDVLVVTLEKELTFKLLGGE